MFGATDFFSNIIFIGCSNKDVMVSYLWSSSGWSFLWRLPIIGGVESGQLNNLLGLLCSVSLSSHMD